MENVVDECRGYGQGQGETLRGPREEVERLKGERVYLDQLAKEGSERARELTGMTLKIVGQRVGLGY